MTVKPIPDGYHTITPYLTVDDLPRMLQFMREAFDAAVTETHAGEDGRIRHAEAMIGDSHVMVGQARAEWTLRPATLYLYVHDTDATYEKAMKAGATSLMAPADQYYGDRNAGVSDPLGNYWWIATHVEDVSRDEMERRAREQMK